MTEPTLVHLRSEALTASVSTLGAELQSLRTAGGEDLLWGGDPAVWSGRAPILFPIVGALVNGRFRLDGREYALPKHGFASRSTFAVARSAPDRATLRLEADAQTRAAYPFAFRLDLTFALAGAALVLEARVSNLGDAPMPFSLGFHPAFRWPLPFGRPRAEHRVAFARPEPAPVRRIDAQGLLTPRLEPTPVVDRTLALRDDLFTDDALIFDPFASRSLSYGAPAGPQLEMSFEGFTQFGAWTKPGADFIALEPRAGGPDPQGFDGDIWSKPGIRTVAPGASADLSMRVALAADGSG